MAEEIIDLQAKRAAIVKALKKVKNGRDAERVVWLLPQELLGRILDYQLEKLLPSEVAAARELLDFALGMNCFPAKMKDES